MLVSPGAVICLRLAQTQLETTMSSSKLASKELALWTLARVVLVTMKTRLLLRSGSGGDDSAVIDSDPFITVLY